MQTRRAKFLLYFFALILIMACVPSLAPAQESSPALDPGQINQIIAQTANAASTQTALAMPTSIVTETFTPTPRNTNTPEPTATETLIYIFTTPTSFVVPTLGPTFSPTSKKDYDCKILSSPKNKEIYDPRVKFKVRWRVQNIGRREWEHANVDYVYDSGDRFHIIDGYDVPDTIPIGDVADLFIDMQAPKNPGMYTTNWTLASGAVKFCKLTLTIIVK